MRAVLTLLALLAAAFACADDRQKAIDAAFRNQLADQAEYWFDDGDFPRVAQIFRIMCDQYPHDYELATNLGFILGNMQQFEEELSVYTRFRKDNVGERDAPFPEANFYYAKKMYSKVPALIEPTLKQDPHANSYRILAHSYERQGLLKDAVRIWNLYLSRHPDDLTAVARRKRLQAQLGGG